MVQCLQQSVKDRGRQGFGVLGGGVRAGGFNNFSRVTVFIIIIIWCKYEVFGILDFYFIVLMIVYFFQKAVVKKKEVVFFWGCAVYFGKRVFVRVRSWDFFCQFFIRLRRFDMMVVRSMFFFLQFCSWFWYFASLVFVILRMLGSCCRLVSWDWNCLRVWSGGEKFIVGKGLVVDGVRRSFLEVGQGYFFFLKRILRDLQVEVLFVFFIGY